MKYSSIVVVIALLGCKQPNIEVPQATNVQGASEETGQSEDQNPEGPPEEETSSSTDSEGSTDPETVVTPPETSPPPVVEKPVETITGKMPEPPVVKPEPVDPPVVVPKPIVKRYVIMGEASRKCITAPDMVGVQFKIYDCTNAPNQLFTLEQVAPDTMKIVSHKGHVMELQGGNAYDLTVVQTGDYTAKPSQEFRIEAKNFETFATINVRNTSSTLDAAYKSNDNGTGIIIYRTDSPAANQRWKIQAVN